MPRTKLAAAVLVVGVALGLPGCAAAGERGAGGASRQPLTVYAAASLTDAFSEIGTAFEAAHPGVDVRFNFAGSQNLRTQLEQGAAADVFASANVTEMETLIEDGLVGPGSAEVFATNRLVIAVPDGNPADIRSPHDLSRPGVKLILAAEEVPAGQYAQRVLGQLDALYGGGYLQLVTSNVVSYEDNVRTVLTKVELGEADAGIVYASDAVPGGRLPTIAIPSEVNVVAEYPITVLAESPRAELAAAFLDAVLSAAGQATLEKWGFTRIDR